MKLIRNITLLLKHLLCRTNLFGGEDSQNVNYYFETPLKNNQRIQIFIDFSYAIIHFKRLLCDRVKNN